MSGKGIHHVTAIAGPAQCNLDFYTRILGLRLVKKTVNFDDPGTYHLYYGNEAGRPGSILTFFPWEHVAPGRIGLGETQETVFRVPEGSIDYWTQRFVENGVAHQPLTRRFGEPLLSFQDPDGMRLALVAVPGIENETGWAGAGIPANAAIRGFHSVNLLLAQAAPTGAILTDIFGFSEVGREGSLVRYRVPDGGAGSIVDINEASGYLPARLGGGSVHHIAFRAADDAEEAAMVRKLAENHRIRTTEQKDRNYFRSVYFREPGHVLFEIATDVPGFAVDEPASTLGEALKLPAFLERRRSALEASLPRLEPSLEPSAT